MTLSPSQEQDNASKQPPQFYHLKAAEHNEQAAKHNKQAAHHHESGDHKTAAHHALIAEGHMLQATEQREEASKKYTFTHGAKM